jgi:uncharacterized RDD family membrane protein YckC
MRCPKCHYISFDSGDRCRNCGYEFSLSIDAAALDLPIQTGDEPLGPLTDFSLADLDSPAAAVAPPSAPLNDPSPPRTASDLPLFKDRASGDDRPLVTPPAVPRPPLSVRRGPPVVPRSPQRRVEVDEPVLDLGLDDGDPGYDAPPVPPARVPTVATADLTLAPAPAGARLLGGLVDLGILGSIDTLVLYLTLRLCGLQWNEIGILPPVPFAGFLLMLNGAYFITFTVAGGQTIGKMAASTRVIPAARDTWSDRVPLPQAIVRTAAYLVSLLPLGAGFLPAFLGGERRALHDRLAGTRVVTA